MWLLLVSTLALGQSTMSLDLGNPDWPAFERQASDVCRKKQTEWDFDNASRWRVSVALQFAEALDELATTEIPGVEAQIADFRTDDANDPVSILDKRFETLRGNMLAHSAIFSAEARTVPLLPFPTQDRVRWPARVQARRTCVGDYRAVAEYMVTAQGLIDAYNGLAIDAANLLISSFNLTTADSTLSP